MIVTTSLALVSTIVLTPPIRQVALTFGVVDRPSSRKFHIVSTPYLGGVAILAGILLANGLTRTLPTLAWQLLGLAAIVGMVGLWDDLWPMAWRPKLAVESVAAAAAGVVIWTSFAPPQQTALLVASLTAGVGATILITNSFNLLDNIDAHCASVTLAANVGIALAANTLDQTKNLVALPLTVSATCLAFLMFNLSKRMKIFLGDSGSLMLGFVTTTTAVAVLAHGSLVQLLVCLPLFLLVPALDTCTVVFDRKRHSVPIFTPGKDHLSHRLVRLGLDPLQSVSVWAALQLAGSLAAYAILAASSPSRWLLAILPTALAAAALFLVLKIDNIYEGEVASSN